MQHGLFSDHVMQRLVRMTRRYINEKQAGRSLQYGNCTNLGQPLTEFVGNILKKVNWRISSFTGSWPVRSSGLQQGRNNKTKLGNWSIFSNVVCMTNSNCSKQRHTQATWASTRNDALDCECSLNHDWTKLTGKGLLEWNTTEWSNT